MGMILSSRVKDDGKIIVEFLVDYDEYVQMKGQMDNVHLFSENVSELKMTISQRGKDESTKYFLIPKDLRKGVNMNGKTSCQKIDTKTKSIFIYVVDKTGA